MNKAYLDALPGADGRLIREITRRTYVDAQGATPVHDSSAVFYLLRPEAYVTVQGKIRVVPDGIAAGQTLLGHPTSQSTLYVDRPVNQVAVGVDASAVLGIYYDVLAASGQ
jgi:inosine-uridine nucleoside N-ribohydrolase